nr:hypothetical protein [Tanacetum cinerariifolium]
MRAVLRFKVAIYKQVFKLTASRSFCSSRTNITVNPCPKTLNQLLNQRPQLSQLKQIHAQVITQSLSSYSVLIDSLIHCYISINSLTYARTLFDQYPNYPPPILLWNLVMRSYSKHQNSLEPINFFRQMSALDDSSLVVADKFTFTFLITSCTHQNSDLHGKIVHGMVIKNGYTSNLYVGNSVINFYAVFCKLDDACKVFDEMSERDVFSWTSLLDQGKSIHAYVNKIGLTKRSNISTALIDMYAKCGVINYAYRVFHKIFKPDVCNYTSMISAFSAHGLGNDSLRVFHQMVAENVSPNEVTLIGVLKGCSHSGLVQEGSSIFYKMGSLWNIAPTVEHYGCFVDLLGRAGYLKTALALAIKMPLDPDIVIWRTLLSACTIYKDASLADKIIANVRQGYFSHFSGSEVLLSNLYASLSKWERVDEVRDQMSQNKNKPASNIGCSWIEVNGIVHEFRVDDKLHQQVDKLNEVLQRLTLEGSVSSDL